MITNLTCDGDGVSLSTDGRPLTLSWRWLRDHARDPHSFLASAQQRLVTPDVVAAAGPGSASIVEGCLAVSWPDGTDALYDSALLTPLAAPAVMYPPVPIEPLAWRGDELNDRLTTLTFEEITTTGLPAALDGLFLDGVISVTDVPTDTASTRAVLERFGYVRTTIFGDLWDFSSDDSASVTYDDTASTPLEITPHTDGTYSNDAPGLLGLHCHTYRATGGENVFVDSHALVAALSDEERATLSSNDIPGQYIGDGAHLIARRPALRYEQDRLVQVSYNHHDRAPFVLPEPTMTQLFDALLRFDELANDPAMQYEVALRPGAMVIFDNWRLLHGRRAFQGARHIAGGYINREDVESTYRTVTSAT